MNDQNSERLSYDVVIVGAGPAGLSAAIRLKQIADKARTELRVCVLEKGAAVGAHILSGCVFDPIALNQLIPDWQEKGAPLHTKVQQDAFRLLGRKRNLKLPLPRMMKNDGCYIVSLSALTRWLGSQAEALGVEIFPGFSATDVVLDQGRIAGVVTGEVGRAKDGSKKDTWQPGVTIEAKYTLIAEGARGSLAERMMKRYNLRAQSDPQTYGLGIKEVWRVDKAHHRPGLVEHTVGWPLDKHTYGGGFVYHYDEDKVALGLVVGLDYSNPYLDPHEEMQRWKTHSHLKNMLQHGKRIAYGARTLNEGGLQSIPNLVFPGGALIGCSAGFLNVPRIKGSHTAMQSGMYAAEATFKAWQTGQDTVLYEYPAKVAGSWVYKELHTARNIRPFMDKGLYKGLLLSAIEMVLFRGKTPWLARKTIPDHECLRKANECKPIPYPAPDNTLTFDKLTSISLSNVHHEEDQAVHLLLKNHRLPITYNLLHYAAPEQRYCPAGVYEIVEEQGQRRIQINAQNCIHCKTCDIKDPQQNILWVPPEGGGGPNYSEM